MYQIISFKGQQHKFIKFTTLKSVRKFKGSVYSSIKTWTLQSCHPPQPTSLPKHESESLAVDCKPPNSTTSVTLLPLRNLLIFCRDTIAAPKTIVNGLKNINKTALFYPCSWMIKGAVRPFPLTEHWQSAVEIGLVMRDHQNTGNRYPQNKTINKISMKLDFTVKLLERNHVKESFRHQNTDYD